MQTTTEHYPSTVLDYARRKQKYSDAVLSVYERCVLGVEGQSAVAQELDIQRQLVHLWTKDLRVLKAKEEQKQENDRSVARKLTTSEVRAKRAQLLAEAELKQGIAFMRLRKEILDSEARSLGMDVQRVEEVSLHARLDLSPSQVADELAARLHRLSTRGLLHTTASQEGDGPPRDHQHVD